MSEATLTTKQEAFVAAYLGAAHGNATEAARMAGYKSPKQQGTENLAKPAISARIKAHVSKQVATADDVLRELADVAFADWREFVTVRTNPRSGLPVDVKMDLTNKVKALELLGKYHSLFVEKQQIDVNIREHRVVGIVQADLDAMFAPAPPRELTA